MLKCFRDFASDQSGAVTVDWVVLTAATVGLGLVAVTAVRTGVVSLGDEVGSSLSLATVASLAGTPPALPEFIYTALVLTPSQVVEEIDEYTFNDDTDEEVQSWYAWRVMQATQLMDDGQDAALSIDYSYTLGQALRNRGLEPVSPNGETVETLFARYQSL